MPVLLAPDQFHKRTVRARAVVAAISQRREEKMTSKARGEMALFFFQK